MAIHPKSTFMKLNSRCWTKRSMLKLLFIPKVPYWLKVRTDFSTLNSHIYVILAPGLLVDMQTCRNRNPPIVLSQRSMERSKETLGTLNQRDLKASSLRPNTPPQKTELLAQCTQKKHHAATMCQIWTSPSESQLIHLVLDFRKEMCGVRPKPQKQNVLHCFKKVM